MRKVLLILSIFMLSLTSYAQKYDRQHGYDLFSNCYIGGSLGAAHNLSLKGNDFIFDIRMLKKVNSFSRVRGIVEVMGLPKVAHFDRYAKVMIGAQIDALPFYFGGDYGFVFNPSSNSKFGMAGDVFVGLDFKNVFIEIGCDRANNGELWQSNVFAKVGYNVSLGITEDDRTELSIKEYQSQALEDERVQNAQLRVQVNQLTNENAEYKIAIDKVTQLCETVSKQLETCNQNLQIVNTSTFSIPTITFEYASTEVSPADYERLYYLAKEIIASGKHYRCEGYSSSDGDLYNNQNLSTERAKAVYDILRTYDVPEDNISFVGKGISYEYENGVSILNRMVKIIEVY